MQRVSKIVDELKGLDFADLDGGERQPTNYYLFRYPRLDVYTPSLSVVNILYMDFNIIPYCFSDVYYDGRMERCFQYKLSRVDWTNDVD